MLKELEQQLEDIRKAEEWRNNLIESVKDKVKELYVERDKLQSKLEQAEDLRDKYFNDLKESRNHVEELQLKINANPFCLVLIDADNTLFCDGYVKRGSDGGRDAAVQLNGHIMKLLRTKANFQPHWKIIIRLYADISKLCKVYVSSGIIHDAATWQKFVQGFNKEAPLCEFVDAGGDKESADTRVKETFSLFSANVHCKHIILAASGDNGYTGFLRQFVPAQEPSDFITLIEARPFPAQLKQIAGFFRIETFPSVFRKSDLGSIRSPSVMMNRNSFDGSANEVSPALRSPSTKPPAYAIGMAGTQIQTLPISPPTSNWDLTGTFKVVRICFNQNGHRLDPVAQYDKRLCASLKQRKLCNAFFLSNCESTKCAYDHQGSLSHEELNTLKYIARLSPCKSIYCQDACCILGHVCPHGGSNCIYGKACKFPVVMHNVDTKIDNGRTFEIAI